MTLLPLTECCQLLGVDPKTLRLWLTSAHLSGTVHPGDARLKCLTQPQLEHLATLHGRFLPQSLTSTTPLAPTAEPLVAKECSPSCSEPSPHADLLHTVTLLQTQVATLQEQVTHLALSLLRERDGRWEEHLRLAHPWQPAPATIAPTHPSAGDPPASRLSEPATRAAPVDPSSLRPRSGSRVLPLIESGADGRYLLICPTQGALSLIPDSPEWFDWLASLTAFTFQGAQGRFSATRKFRHGQRVQSWSAYRSLHGRSCTLYLGVTSHLTLAHLEHMATTIHARLTTF